MGSVRGMTLIEVLLVLGIVSLLAGTAAISSIGDLRRASIAQDHSLLTDALMLARARAQSGRCQGDACTRGQDQGAKVTSGAFTVFEGASFAQRNASADFLLSRTSEDDASGPGEIVFRIGTGSVSNPGTIGISPTHSIDIREDGSLWP